MLVNLKETFTGLELYLVYMSSLERDAVRMFGIVIWADAKVVEIRLFAEIDFVETVHCRLGSTDLGFIKDDTVKVADVDNVPPIFLTMTLKKLEVTELTAVVLHPETQAVFVVKYLVSVGILTSAIKYN